MKTEYKKEKKSGSVLSEATGGFTYPGTGVMEPSPLQYFASPVYIDKYKIYVAITHKKNVFDN